MCACVGLCCRLTLNRSGGQCLDEAGARVRRWSWSSLSLTPTPLHPVFLSLNKAVGVRILGRERVFVSFLARGQQAKFSVGTCCAQVKHCLNNLKCLGGVHWLHFQLRSTCCVQSGLFFTTSADICSFSVTFWQWILKPLELLFPLNVLLKKLKSFTALKCQLKLLYSILCLLVQMLHLSCNSLILLL